MAVRSIFKRASMHCVSRSFANSFTSNSIARNLSGGAICVNNRAFSSGCDREIPPNIWPDISDLPNLIDYKQLPDYNKYRDLLRVTEGFGIDFDLCDHPDIIRPYTGSLYDHQITHLARFAVEEHNRREGMHLKFMKLIKANYQSTGDMYYMTLDAMDESGKVKRYLVLAARENGIQMYLISFDCFGDADGPPVYYVKKVFYRSKVSRRGMYCDPERVRNPHAFVAEEHYFPRDYFKYHEQFKASEGFDVDGGLYTGCLSGKIVPFNGPLDDPMLESVAHFAVDEYNKNENAELQFVRVVKATYQIICDICYYLTLEVDDVGERKICQAKVVESNLRGRQRNMLLLLFRPRDKSGYMVKPAYYGDGFRAMFMR